MRKLVGRELWLQEGGNYKVKVTSTPSELNILDGVTSTAAEINLLDGASLSVKDVTATAAEVNGAADLSAQAVMAAGAGFAGTGTLYKSSVVKHGDIIKTEIFIDLTGAKSKDTDLDIIGNSGVSHIGQITTAVNGTIIRGQMTCCEVPTTGADDVDLYMATEGTGAYDGAVGDLAETALITAGGAWTLYLTKVFAATVAANKYLYLCSGEAVAGTYDAGQFLIELWGI